MLQQPNQIFSQNNKFSEGIDLFVFTPRSHGVTILRPQVFNFDEQMANDFTSVNATENLGTLFKDPSKESTRNAILPSHKGIQLDTTNFDNCWSFILVIDGQSMVFTDARYGSPKNRTVLTGYFLEEPFAPHTLQWTSPIPNLHAKMMFTRESKITLQALAGYQGTREHAKVAINNDLIPQAVSVMPMDANGDLMLTDTGSIAKLTGFQDNGNERFISGDSAVIGQFQKAKSVPRCMYNPHQQLMGLSQAIHTGIIEAEALAENQNATCFGSNQNVPYEFQTYTNSQVGLLNRSIPSVGTGEFNPSVPSTFGDLNHMFPNMRAHPLKVPTTTNVDIYGQENIHVRSTMSNLAVSVISGMATEYQISSIMFRYSTWSPDQTSRLTGGVWNIEAVTPIVSLDDQKFYRDIERFKNELSTSLWPVLQAASGDFDIMVNFDMANSTMVNLNYLDNGDAFGGSYYEHHNRLGGIAASNIGDDSTFHNNLNQYTALLGKIGGTIDPYANIEYGQGLQVPQCDDVRSKVFEPYEI